MDFQLEWIEILNFTISKILTEKKILNIGRSHTPMLKVTPQTINVNETVAATLSFGAVLCLWYVMIMRLYLIGMHHHLCLNKF